MKDNSKYRWKLKAKFSMSIELTMQILHLVLRFPVHFPCKCILEIKHVDCVNYL
jgi:hypothetical protein